MYANISPIFQARFRLVSEIAKARLGLLVKKLNSTRLPSQKAWLGSPKCRLGSSTSENPTIMEKILEKVVHYFEILPKTCYHHCLASSCCLVVWTLSRGRKVGVPRGILPQVQGGVEPPSTRQLELKPAWDKGGILRPVQS